MSDVVKKNQAWAAIVEDTEGEYKAPVAGNEFIQTLTEGSEMSRSKQLLERNVFTASIGQTAPRTGMFEVSGSLAVEAKSAQVEGEEPQFDGLMQSALGDRRQLTSPVTTGSGHTTSVINIADADESFAVGDIVLIKEDDAFHVSPISAVSSSSITLLVPAENAFSNAVVVAKHTTYICADSGHPALSISRYLEGTILQAGIGCKVSSLALENFSTGAIPNFKFGFEGLNFDSSLTPIPATPSYDTNLPPIMLAGKVFMDGAEIDVNELSFSLENTLGFKTSINAENGKTSSRATERTISGSFNPYMASDSMANYNKFKDNTSFSIFAYAKLPSATEGEFSGIVAVYMPNCLITELSEADNDGLMQDNITFSANRGTAGDKPEIYITFI